MTWQEFMGLVDELPDDSRFWRAVYAPLHAEQRRRKQIDAQRAEQRKKLGLGAPPFFRHRSR